MANTPTIKELNAFLVTAKTLNFTQAAQALNITQGAVSRQIIALENRLNVTLFSRHARGLALTEKGHQFLPLVEKALNQLQHAVAAVTSDKQKITLKAPSCITPWLLPKLMTFQQRFPDIDVELTSAINHNVDFSTEAFSAAICYQSPTNSKRLNSQLLFEEVLAPMCAPHLLGEHTTPLTIEQLSQFTWLHATPNKSDWQLWLQQHHSEQVSATNNQHFATLDLAVSASIQGFGIAVGDITLAEQDILSGRLVLPLPSTVASGKGYYLLCPHENMTDSMTRLFEWLNRDSDPSAS
ncbi:transcriptional regulator [Photobacterium sanctipauli]|uniref:Transcriptional regulator n=2 Tax=Photobacterium sanctipauli TaxID=1342794 RepID=A0A2T3NUS3_9GAMM|nr:LysR substrate-binding domain-containing protein [Photobacterium sanctipauli]PSW19988.1 transcriptional regulator [Photobacterium sanctipauli]